MTPNGVNFLFLYHDASTSLVTTDRDVDGALVDALNEA